MSYNVDTQILDNNGSQVTSLNTEIYNGIRFYLPNRWYVFGMQIANYNVLTAKSFSGFTANYTYVMLYFIPNDITITKWRTKFGTVGGGLNLRFGIYKANKEKVLDLTFTRPNAVNNEVVEVNSSVTLTRGYYYVAYKGGYPNTTNGFIGHAPNDTNTSICYSKKFFPVPAYASIIPRYASSSTSFDAIMPTLSNDYITAFDFPILIHDVTSVNIN